VDDDITPKGRNTRQCPVIAVMFLMADTYGRQGGPTAVTEWRTHFLKILLTLNKFKVVTKAF